MDKTVKLTFIGEDSWGRPVFRGANGHIYKSTELVGASKEAIFADIVSCDNDFEGEPDFPVSFTPELEGELPWLQ